MSFVLLRRESEVSSIDKKLKRILRAYGEEIDPQGVDDGDMKKAIAAIKAVFAEGEQSNA